MYNFRGCLKSPTDVRDYKIACSSRETIPDEYEIEFLPRVKNQKSVNSCVAHSSSSILEYYELVCGREQKLSTNFIYGIQRSHCGHDGQGMYLRDACKIVKDFGDMLEEDCPGNDEVPDAHSVAEEATKDANKLVRAESFKIKSYFSCTSNDAIKKAIMNYGPLLASIKWYDSYIPNKDGVLSSEKSGESGYHAIMIYGWDKTGFKCQNSWGRTWGNKGRFISPYDIKIAEARCFVDEIDNNIIVPKRNAFLDFFYKIINFFANLFKN